MKNKIVKLFLFSLSLLNSLNTFGRRVYDFDDDTEKYDWNGFNRREFYESAILCAAIIVLGLYFFKKFNNKYLKGIGLIIIVLGGLFAFGRLVNPILGAIAVIWPVVIGSAAFFGIIYWANRNFSDKE